MAWLIERYRETSAWTDLSLATRRQRENIFKQMIAAAGAQPHAKITSAVTEASRDRRRDTPSQARHFLDTLRGLFRWAKKAKLVKVDPTVDVEDPKRAKTDGFQIWSEDAVATYRRRWPLGTRERVWLEVGLNTGLAAATRSSSASSMLATRPTIRSASSRSRPRRPAPK
jgi:site-specific recombinase XerD